MRGPHRPRPGGLADRPAVTERDPGRVEGAVTDLDLAAGGRRERCGLEVDDATDRGRAVQGGPRTALHLDQSEARREITEVDREELMRLRRVERDAVDVDRDPRLVEPADAQVAVAEAVPGVAVGVRRGHVPQEGREVLAVVLPANLLRIEVRERGGVLPVLRDG